MNIAEASITTGLSTDTIRYYEKCGMLPRIRRDGRGWRDFDGEAVAWLVTLERLRSTGMPMSDMHRFAQLAQKGDEAMAERLSLLRTHSERLQRRRAEIDACQAFLDGKIRFYSQMSEAKNA